MEKEEKLVLGRKMGYREKTQAVQDFEQLRSCGKCRGDMGGGIGRGKKGLLQRAVLGPAA